MAGGRAARDRSPGGGRHRRVAHDRRARDVSSPAGPLGRLSRRLAGGQAGASIARWRTRPTLRSTPIAAPGISPKRRRGSTRTSPPSSSAPQAALKRAGDWPQPPPSWKELPLLTPEPSRRARRALAAAHAKHQAGGFDAALRLVAIAESGPLNELQRAHVDLLRGQIAFALSRGSDAAPLLLEAAKRLEPFDPVLARETYAEAFAAAMYAGRLAKSVGVAEVAKAARAAKRAGASPQPARAQDLLLDGQALLITERPRAATPMLKRALSAFRGHSLSNDDALRWLWLACTTAIQLWDDESWYVLSDRHVQLARDAGALTVLPLALNYCAGSRVSAGEFAAAEALVEEAQGVSLAIANPDVSISSLNLAGWRGRQTEALELIQASDRDAASRGEGRRIGAGHYATAVLYNGLGRYQLALDAARQALEYPLELATSRWALGEQVEAAARSGQPEPAALALRQLSQSTRGQRDRLGARDRGAVPCAAERGRGRRWPLSRSDRGGSSGPASA